MSRALLRLYRLPTRQYWVTMTLILNGIFPTTRTAIVLLIRFKFPRNRDLKAFGCLRAAYLREKRIHVDTLYLPGDGDPVFGTISDQKLEILHLFSKSFDLIGMSILTHHNFIRVISTSPW